MNKEFDQFLSTFPKLRQGIVTRKDPRDTFLSILRLFERAGFHVAAADKRLMRFCGYRRGRQYNCTCVHVIWVTPDEVATHVNYGIEPQQGLLRSCDHRDHLEKLHECGRAVHKAIDEIPLKNEWPERIVNGRSHSNKFDWVTFTQNQIIPRSPNARSQFVNPN